LKETNHAHETRLIRVIPRRLGKSRFAQDSVVELGGLEPPTRGLWANSTTKKNEFFGLQKCYAAHFRLDFHHKKSVHAKLTAPLRPRYPRPWARLWPGLRWCKHPIGRKTPELQHECSPKANILASAGRGDDRGRKSTRVKRAASANCSHYSL